MSLEQSMEKLASAMTLYAEVIQKYAVEIKAAVTGKKAPADEAEEEEEAPAAKKGAGRPKGSTVAKKAAGKKAAEPEEEEEEEVDDGMGGEEEEEEEESELTLDDVKKKLQEVKTAYDDRATASGIFRDLGYQSVADIKPKDLQKVYDLAVKKLKKAPK